MPQSGSKVTGTVRVAASGASFTIRLEATGLQPATTHLAHIHAGACGTNGAIVFPLESMVANGSGDAAATTWIRHPYQVPASGWSVQIHKGPTMSGTGGTPIACASLPAH
jgi:Cu/Zn superoxide dismutase